jgi:hypothetical protein
VSDYTYRRIIWHYEDDENAEHPIARTSWADPGHLVERLHSAGFEGVGRWHAGEALEDALGLCRDSGSYGGGSVLEVEYLDGAAAAHGRVAMFTIVETDHPDD